MTIDPRAYRVQKRLGVSGAFPSLVSLGVLLSEGSRSKLMPHIVGCQT